MHIVKIHPANLEVHGFRNGALIVFSVSGYVMVFGSRGHRIGYVKIGVSPGDIAIKKIGRPGTQMIRMTIWIDITGIGDREVPE
jgi:hypothetical protein